MQIAISARDDGGRVATDDLRGWLGRQRELRGCVKRGSGETPAPGTMGTAAELVTVLLAPGGVATVLAAAVVAWVQNRSGSQTVTITRPDGTEITVTSDRVKGLTAQQTGDLAQQIAGHLEPQSQPSAQPELSEQGQQTPRVRQTPQGTAGAGSADTSRTQPRPGTGSPDPGVDGRLP